MLLLFKIFLVPVMVALVTLAARTWGPTVGGLLAGLPIIVGPILVFLAIDQGADFAAASAHAALAGVISIGAFCFAYSVFSLKNGVALSLSSGLLAFAVATSLLTMLNIPPVWTLAIVVATLAVYLWRLPSGEAQGERIYTSSVEILFRMLAAAGLVLVITLFSATLGPKLSGLLAPFPIAGTIFSGFTHHFAGPTAVRGLLRGFIKGLFGMAAFTFVFCVALPHMSLASTVGIALVITIDNCDATNLEVHRSPYGQT